MVRVSLRYYIIFLFFLILHHVFYESPYVIVAPSLPKLIQIILLIPCLYNSNRSIADGRHYNINCETLQQVTDTTKKVGDTSVGDRHYQQKVGDTSAGDTYYSRKCETHQQVIDTYYNKK